MTAPKTKYLQPTVCASINGTRAARTHRATLFSRIDVAAKATALGEGYIRERFLIGNVISVNAVTQAEVELRAR